MASDEELDDVTNELEREVSHEYDDEQVDDDAEPWPIAEEEEPWYDPFEDDEIEVEQPTAPAFSEPTNVGHDALPQSRDMTFVDDSFASSLSADVISCNLFPHCDAIDDEYNERMAAEFERRSSRGPIPEARRRAPERARSPASLLAAFQVQRIAADSLTVLVEELVSATARSFVPGTGVTVASRGALPAADAVTISVPSPHEYSQGAPTSITLRRNFPQAGGGDDLTCRALLNATACVVRSMISDPILSKLRACSPYVYSEQAQSLDGTAGVHRELWLIFSVYMGTLSFWEAYLHAARLDWAIHQRACENIDIDPSAYAPSHLRWSVKMSDNATLPCLGIDEATALAVEAGAVPVVTDPNEQARLAVLLGAIAHAE